MGLPNNYRLRALILGYKLPPPSRVIDPSTCINVLTQNIASDELYYLGTFHLISEKSGHFIESCNWVNLRQ